MTAPYIVTCGTALLTGCSGGATPSGEALTDPIPLADVQSRGVLGKLGVPLGRIVRVDGIAVDGKTLRFKAAQSKTFVEVGAVDGRQLYVPVLVELSIHWLAEETVKKPSPGQAVRLVGWETGGYAGIVDGEFDHVPGYAGTAYHFDTSFVAVKAE